MGSHFLYFNLMGFGRPCKAYQNRKNVLVQVSRLRMFLTLQTSTNGRLNLPLVLL